MLHLGEALEYSVHSDYLFLDCQVVYMYSVDFGNSADPEISVKMPRQLLRFDDTEPRQSQKITLTFINRVSGRKLANQEQYLERLQ
ncbi:unnamed protein product [Penicillium roqueforti FM164]|uniref:Genomic scaffold, ProqFM164S02 n=1 Tax=Penicillium roqueforti (strain FM164) TaxID=1365484 RepID=W6Q0L4_PENRF|nr:unnamed protein product [Penicillium roqueforti FM164]